MKKETIELIREYLEHCTKNLNEEQEILEERLNNMEGGTKKYKILFDKKIRINWEWSKFYRALYDFEKEYPKELKNES